VNSEKFNPKKRPKETAMLESQQLYAHGPECLEGRLWRPLGGDQMRPAVLLLHEYTGMGDYLSPHAERLVDLGWIVLAADIYGVAQRPDSPEAARQIYRIYRDDRRLLRGRTAAGLACLKALPGVDPNGVVALGFSFGGCAALELVRKGSELAGAISIYGYLDAPLSKLSSPGDTKILVIHGARDPIVPNGDLLAFMEEMSSAGADCRIKVFTDAGHGFCNRSLDGHREEGNGYGEKHDGETWREVTAFLDSINQS
jgi:dienelactone hydrolase